MVARPRRRTSSTKKSASRYLARVGAFWTFRSSRLAASASARLTQPSSAIWSSTQLRRAMACALRRIGWQLSGPLGSEAR